MQEMDKYRSAEKPNAVTQKDAKGPEAPGEAKTFRNAVGETGEDLAHPLIPAKRVNGSAVFNQAGEQVGKIEDVVIDKRSGKVAYAILSFGGLMGLGEKHQPLPWSALQYDKQRDGYSVEVTEEFLRLAPKLDTSELSGWDDTAQRDKFFAYYAPMGVTPYW